MFKVVLKKIDYNFNGSIDYAIELWDCSTKHSDYTYYFRRYVETECDTNLQSFATLDDSFIQWVAHIASHRMFEFSALRILNFGMDIRANFQHHLSDMLDGTTITWYYPNEIVIHDLIGNCDTTIFTDKE